LYLFAGILLRPQQQGTEPKSWNIDAKPFLGKSVRNIFETEPLRVLDEFTDSELSTLLVDKETIYGTHRDRAARLQSVKHPIARKYQRLLQLEEMQQENDIKLCDLHFCKPRYAIFEREGNPRSYRFVGEEKVCFYRGPILRRIQLSGVVAFRVPGIIEGRPSLKVGSLIRVRCATVPEDEYTMLCLGLESSDVFCLPPLGFRKSLLFHSLTQSIHGAVEMEGAPIKKQSVSIRFELDLPYQRMINSMDNLLSSNDSLLPNRDLVVKNLSLLPSISDVDALSESLELSDNLNHEQRYAVASFLLGAGRPSPYCLLGPPGTGKTLTATNCVLQILKRYPHARILCCAPKNFSADTMCWELGKRGISVTQMIRLNDPRRPCFTMRDDIMQYSVTNASGMFEIPSMCRLQEYQVIVCSCIAASYVPPGSRTHIVMDEAGEALLPESMMALASLKVGDENDNGWGVFLCGDPKQLGPIVRSRVASQGGLQKSLLEHLMSLYDSSNHLAASQNTAPRNYMLRINYRSSKELLDLPSRLFYSGQLEAASEYNQELRSQVQPPHFQWHEEDLSKHVEAKNLQNCRPSTVFYSVHGSQVRVGDSPSFFNPIEASTICHLVKQLLATQKDSKDTLGGEVRPSDIGVISTFRQQVYTIREILRSFGLGNIRVGTIDDYQGQEEKIILISTVLSDVSTLGEASSSLFSNPNRFNVATTRAKALLVCAGHPEVLLADTCWKEFVRSCIIKGNVFGAGSSCLLNSLSSDLHENLNGDGRAEGLLKSDFAKTLDQLADLAVLGRGSLPILYPNSIEDEYMADSGYGEDMPWRVLL
jgi:DNA polymerase III delta prime subunit